MLQIYLSNKLNKQIGITIANFDHYLSIVK